jgi:phage shock protein PspC (stress-responsive transcriptional regulator)
MKNIFFVFALFVSLCLSGSLIAQHKVDTTKQSNAPPSYDNYNNLNRGMPMDYDFVVKKSFDTNPDTVYGVFVGVLVFSLLSMGIALYLINSKFIDVVSSNTAVMQSMLAKMDTNDEKVLNGLQKLLEGHRQEMQQMTTTLFTNLLTQFMGHITPPRDKL